MNLGLDLPCEEQVDNDSDSSFGFEIGLDNAYPHPHKKNAFVNQDEFLATKNWRDCEESDSLERRSSNEKEAMMLEEDQNPNNEFLNQSGNKKAIASAIGKVRAEKRNLIQSANPNKFQKSGD
mmetsp:Transcript_15718/g.15190  ORF Transcript_15718/g.15190 Transcript_15718/m.15190 type:complete len:123 (+) Transcript_15718:1198-1566(+)